MGRIVRVIKLGGALVIAIPRDIARELDITRRDYVAVTRVGSGSVVVTKVKPEHYAPSPRR